MKIRSITSKDHPALMQFWKKNYFVNEMDNYKSFNLFLKKNRGLSFVAKEEGKIVGTVLGSFDGRHGFLQKLVVDKDFRKKGIGRKLLETIIKTLKTNGALEVWLACLNINAPFYEKNGFKKTELTALTYSLINASDACKI